MKRANFDSVARIYRWAEYVSLGPLLQRTRNHFLPQLKFARQALVLGDGDGRFLARLFRQNSGLQAVAVDTSAKMLRLLSERCHAARDNSTQQLRTLHDDALTVQPASDVDLIVTHFFLDCLTQDEVNALTFLLGSAVQSGTMWLVSDFATPRVMPWAGNAYIRLLYLAFGWLTGMKVRSLPDPQSALKAAGFNRTARREFAGGLVYTEIWRRE